MEQYSRGRPCPAWTIPQGVRSPPAFGFGGVAATHTHTHTYIGLQADLEGQLVARASALARTCIDLADLVIGFWRSDVHSA
mmetsp:Transcript_124727/g.313632  ORF Transcript_124727/g.313632 Transcript_124727/m.313632 type:complete len:81 (-) Transcript_124727:260-502(-)